MRPRQAVIDRGVARDRPRRRGAQRRRRWPVASDRQADHRPAGAPASCERPVLGAVRRQRRRPGDARGHRRPSSRAARRGRVVRHPQTRTTPTAHHHRKRPGTVLSRLLRTGRDQGSPRRRRSRVVDDGAARRSTPNAIAPRSRCSTNTSLDQQRSRRVCPSSSAAAGATYARAPRSRGPFLAGLTTVLGSADGHNAAVARQRVWSALIADATPYNFGAKAHHAVPDLPWSIVEIGLSSVEPQHPPSGARGDGERTSAEPHGRRPRACHAASRDGSRRVARRPAAVRRGGRPVVRAVGTVGRRTNRRRWSRGSRWRSNSRRSPRPQLPATTWRPRSRPGSARRPMCCTPADISRKAGRYIRGSSR